MKTLKVEDLKKIINYDSYYDSELMIQLDLGDKMFDIPAKELLNNEDLVASLHNITMSDYDKYSISWSNVCNELYRKNFNPSWNLVKKIYETESLKHMLNTDMETTILLVSKQQMLLDAIKRFENGSDNDLQIIENIIEIEKNNPKIKIGPKIEKDTMFCPRSWVMPYDFEKLLAINLLVKQEIENTKPTVEIDEDLESEIKDGIELCKNVVYYEKLKNNKTSNNNESTTANECYFIFLKNSLKERDRTVKNIKNTQDKFKRAHSSNGFYIQFDQCELPYQETLEAIHQMDQVIINELNRIIQAPNDQTPALYDEKDDVIKLRIDDDFNNCLFIPSENTTITKSASTDGDTSPKRTAIKDYVNSCISDENNDLNYPKEIVVKNETQTLTK